MSIKSNKKRVIISMGKDQYKNFKKLAVEHDMQLSELLVTAGTITPIDQIKQTLTDNAGAAKVE